jgi:hypothetical protein
MGLWETIKVTGTIALSDDGKDGCN